jgi:hypothetical protein
MLTIKFKSRGEVSMKKLFVSVSLGSMMAVAAFGASWSGTVSDSMCGAKHADASPAGQKCVEACVKEHGAAPVLVVGDKIYKLSDDSKAKVMDYLGKKVTVTGKLAGDTITVKSVKG